MSPSAIARPTAAAGARMRARARSARRQSQRFRQRHRRDLFGKIQRARADAASRKPDRPARWRHGRPRPVREPRPPAEGGLSKCELTAITPDVVAAHGLKPDEYQRILTLIGRDPSLTELGIFSAMWNEHCSYKSSRLHLRKLPTSAPWVIQGPGENAGVIDIGDGEACIFKMESHNHPSYIEPYQGAATGVGGILRDVFTMGARPVACLNLLRFGAPGPSAHPPSRRRRRRRHRRLRQQFWRADRRRLDQFPRALRRQHPRQRDGRRHRPRGRDLLCGRRRHRQSDRLSRLEDRARRHPRRDHGVGRLRRGCRGQAPDGAGRRSRSPKSCCSKPASN